MSIIRPWLCLVIGLGLSVQSGAETLSSDSINGYWVMPDGSALLEIYPDDDGYAARIVALRDEHFTVVDGGDSRATVGELRRDIHNPTAELRQRPLVGLMLASKLKFNKGRWEGGRIYDPASGRSYRCEIELLPDGYLRLRGYLGISLFGRTMYWQRAKDFKRQVFAMLAGVP